MCWFIPLFIGVSKNLCVHSSFEQYFIHLLRYCVSFIALVAPVWVLAQICVSSLQIEYQIEYQAYAIEIVRIFNSNNWNYYEINRKKSNWNIQCIGYDFHKGTKSNWRQHNVNMILTWLSYEQICVIFFIVWVSLYWLRQQHHLLVFSGCAHNLIDLHSLLDRINGDCSCSKTFFLRRVPASEKYWKFLWHTSKVCAILNSCTHCLFINIKNQHSKYLLWKWFHHFFLLCFKSLHCKKNFVFFIWIKIESFWILFYSSMINNALNIILR